MSPTRRSTFYQLPADSAPERGIDLLTSDDQSWDVRRYDTNGQETLGSDLERAQAEALYEEAVRAGAVIDGLPGWTHSDVPGLPLAGYGYKVERRIGKYQGWAPELREPFLVLGGKNPRDLDLENPRTVEEVIEAALTQTIEAETLAGREKWLAAAAKDYGHQEDWMRPGAGLYLAATGVRVTAWSYSSVAPWERGERRHVIEKDLPDPEPPTWAEIHAYSPGPIDADSIPVTTEPHTAHLPVRTGDEHPLDGPHFYFPAFQRIDPEYPDETLRDEGVLYDGPHPIAGVQITATTAEALARAQHAAASELAPWATTILFLARAERLCTPEVEEIARAAHLRDDPHTADTWPSSHSDEEVAHAQQAIAEAEALRQAAADALPDAGQGPLPPLSRAWREETAPYARWWDTVFKVLLSRWAPTESPGRDRLIQWTPYGVRHKLHAVGKIPMRAINRALAQDTKNSH